MRQWPRTLSCPRRITAAALIVGAALSFGLGQALGHHAITAGPARHPQASTQRNAASALTGRVAAPSVARPASLPSAPLATAREDASTPQGKHENDNGGHAASRHGSEHGGQRHQGGD
jgi:hypothetical protein